MIIDNSSPIPRNLPTYIPIKRLPWKKRKHNKKNIKNHPKGTEDKSGKYPEKRKTENIFEKVVAARHRFFK
jgi:hypothetical protein